MVRKGVLLLTTLLFFSCGEKKESVCIPKEKFQKEFLTPSVEVVGIKREGPLCGYLVREGKNLNVIWYRDGVVILGVAFNSKKENLNLKLIKSLIPPDRLKIEEEK